MTLEELKKAVDDPKTDPQSKAVGKYLLQKCGGSEEYSAKVQQDGYSLQRCMSYIFYRAAKLNTKHEAMLMIGQDEVFGWADDYFNLDQTQEKKKVKEASELMLQLQSLRRNAQAGKKEEEHDAAKTPEKEKKESSHENKNKTSKDPVQKENGKTGTEAVNGKEKKKTGDKSLEGQFSLFDMIGEGF